MAVDLTYTLILKEAGDKTFINGESIVSQNTGSSAELLINTRGDIYAKGIEPLYVQFLADVQRSNSQNETYKLIIEI